MMSYGFDPYLSSWSPYHGAVYAVTESMARIVASGGDFHKIRFTFQEYFRRMTEDPKRWSQPFAALLGAFDAQVGYGLPSIGGKESMSGTFNDIDGPPTLVSFAVDVAKEKDIITPEFKKPGNKVVRFCMERDEYDIPVYESVMELYEEALLQPVKSRLVMKSMMMSIFAYILRWDEKDVVRLKKKGDKGEYLLAKYLLYMKANLESVSLASLAREFYVSEGN